MFDPNTYDPRILPGLSTFTSAHNQWANHLLQIKVTTPDRADVIRRAALVDGKSPYFGLIAIARLIDLGAKPSVNPPSLLAVWLATALYNAEFDIDRNMRANEKPFDLIVEPSEPFLRALVQGAIEQVTASKPPNELQTVLSARVSGFRQALDEVAAAVEGLRR